MASSGRCDWVNSIPLQKQSNVCSILCFVQYSFIYARKRKLSRLKPGFQISQFIGDLLSGITEGENDFRNTMYVIHRWLLAIRPQGHHQWITVYENQALAFHSVHFRQVLLLRLTVKIPPTFLTVKPFNITKERKSERTSLEIAPDIAHLSGWKSQNSVLPIQLSICRTFLYGGTFLLPQKISSNIMCMSAVILVKFCPPAKSVSSRWASINQLWTSTHIQFNNFFAILQCMSWKPGEWTVESTVALRNIRKILEIASAHNWKKITRNFVPRTDEVTGVAVWDCYRAEIVITLLRMLQLKHAIWARGTAVWNCNPCWSCRAEINCCSEIVIHPNVCLSQIKP